jgi:hypothetical protein
MMNSKIKYFQVPHVTTFKRYFWTGKCFMQYRIFSDRDLLPAVPNDPNLPREDVDVALEPFIHVGGKQQFVRSCIGCDTLHKMNPSQSQKYEVLAKLERDGVFKALQSDILSQYIQQSLVDEFQDDPLLVDNLENIKEHLEQAGSAKREERPESRSSQKMECSKTEKENRGALILWWKGHSAETLRNLKVSETPPP